MKKSYKKSRKKFNPDCEELFSPEDRTEEDELADTSEEHEMIDEDEESYIDPARIVKTFKVKP